MNMEFHQEMSLQCQDKFENIIHFQKLMEKVVRFEIIEIGEGPNFEM